MKIKDIITENKITLEWLSEDQVNAQLANAPEVDFSKTDSDFIPPKNTVKAYKLFRVVPGRPGMLFPLFVKADQALQIGKWYEAEVGEMSGKQVKSSIGKLAYRPGWHAGDLPIATHIGGKSEEQKKLLAQVTAKRKQELETMMTSPDFQNADSQTQKNMMKQFKKEIAKKIPYPASINKPTVRPENHVWAEVEMPADVNWQDEANKRGINPKGKFISKNAHITDQLPKGGFYRYKTNTNMTGNWLIGGALRIIRVLSDKEVEQINKGSGTGVSDLQRTSPFNPKKYGF